MPQGKPRPGELYLHFKQKLYQVITIAVHSETGEKLVVYQALYGDYKVYAREIGAFTGPVDREKYPQVKQRFCFQLVEAKVVAAEERATAPAEKPKETEGKAPERSTFRNREEKPREQNVSQSPEEKMMEFFDVDSMEEKYRILSSMEDEITDHMINNMAVTLDVVVEEGPVQQRYEELKRCVRTFHRYENTRLR